MSETVNAVAELPVKTSTLRKFAKRTTVVALAGAAVTAAFMLKARSNEDSTTETPSA